MKSRPRVVLLATAAVLALAVGTLFVYGESRNDVVADGVTAGGVDLGGMDASEARAVLERRLGSALAKPVTATYTNRRFTLPAQQAGLAIDTRRTVSEALERSNDGGPIARAFRDLTGGSVDARLPVHVGHSPTAVRGFVARVERAVDRPDRNADIGYAGGRLHKLPARNGLDVQTPALTRAVERAIASPVSRVVPVPVRVIERPDVTLGEIARKYPTVITIDRRRKLLRLYRGLRLLQKYPIAVGQAGFETSQGRHEIQDKQVNPAWHAPDKEWAGELAGQTIPPGDPQNPLKARFMEFDEGAGIHGTDDVASLGERASHGCIRMSIPEVKQLFDRVRVGTPVFVD